MSAYPFGDHPTLEDFIKYAEKCGCKRGKDIEIGSPSGKKTVGCLIGKNKLAVPLPILDEDEKYLVPNIVRSLCGKLESRIIIPPSVVDRR